MTQQDTICAIATGSGVGAISIIRVSGKKAWEITSSIFSKNLSNSATHTVHFGTIRDQSNEIVDEVLVSVFSEGKSFTGEESTEISCHGSSYIQQQIIRLLVENGCRMATPGEFTQRAFINGNLDLSQAEAVADLIASQAKNAHNIAIKQLRGGFSNKLKELREQLIHFASMVELELDFAEEDVEFADRTELKQLVSDVLAYISRLIQSFQLGNAIKNGVPVAIVGAPNTGKSTLLNQLLGDERAIVSNIAGTTRDVIEETLNIDGIIFRLIDTAGIRDNAEEIEAMGIERSKQKIEQASLVLCMADATVNGEIEKTANWVNELSAQHPDKKIFLLVNKIDETTVELPQNAIGISAKKGTNIETLKSALVDSIKGDFNLAEETIINNERHHEALLQTQTSLQKALGGLEMNVTGDFVAMDIRQAMFYLGSITGDISTDDLLGNIFSKFCIGK